MTENVYNIESKGLVEPEKIVKSSEGDHGKAILTGWDSSAHNSAIYDMTKIEVKDWDKRPDWRYTFSTYRAVLENCGAVYEKEKQ